MHCSDISAVRCFLPPALSGSSDKGLPSHIPGFLSIRSPSNLVIYSIYKSFILSISNFAATSLLNHRYISGANSLKNTCIRRFPLPIPAP